MLKTISQKSAMLDFVVLFFMILIEMYPSNVVLKQ
jgi:hypothetical protein